MCFKYKIYNILFYYLNKLLSYLSRKILGLVISLQIICKLNKEIEIFWWIKIMITYWLLPIVILLLAPLRLPYGYYIILKVVVCSFSLYFTYFHFKIVRNHFFSAFFMLTICVYNPIFPIILKKDQWFPINILTILLILMHYLYMKRKNLLKELE